MILGSENGGASQRGANRKRASERPTRYLLGAFELEGRPFEHGHGVVLGSGDDPEGSGGSEVDRVDGLGLAADLAHRRSRVGHEHMSESEI